MSTVKRMIMVYYDLSHIFVALNIISINCNNIVLAKVIAYVWEYGDIVATKSKRARNSSSQTFRQVGQSV